MTAAPEQGTHPLLGCTDLLEAALKDVADVSPGFMGLDTKREVLARLARISSEFAALQLRVLAASDDVAEYDGVRDIATWLAHHTRDDRQGLRRAQGLAEALDRRWFQVAGALTEGSLNVAQAQVIVRALDDLPAKEIGTELLQQAEAHLVAQAAHYGPKELAILGRKVLEVIAPDAHEDHEAKQLEAEERRARETTSLTTKRLGDGCTRISIKLPDAAAARLVTYLDAYTSPRQEGFMTEGERLPAPRAMGRAFCSLLEVIDPKRMPLHGGDATTLVVTVPLTALRTELAVAELTDTDLISASEVRRLACTAKIIPAVLGGKSEVLDLGRSSRLFTAAQRKALAIRDRTCRAEGCSIPAAWCEAHHAKTPWSRGGKTDLADGLLLCSHHHHRVHDASYLHTQMPNGDLRFHRRP